MTIQASLKLSSTGELLELRGCERAQERGGRPFWEMQGDTRVRKYPAGTLTLRFASGSEGLKELTRRAAMDDGFALAGKMTVVDEGKSTEYDCGFESLAGNDVSFVFACIK